MNNKESHPIRNGIIIGVVTGIIFLLWPLFRDILIKVIFWIFSIFKKFREILNRNYSVTGWIIFLLTILSLSTFLRFIKLVVKKPEKTFLELYRKDDLFGGTWKWDYFNGDIINLWCLCPKCQAELVYQECVDSWMHQKYDEEDNTKFVCEKCDEMRIKLKGSKSYALGTVEREIRRKIRTEEWKNR